MEEKYLNYNSKKFDFSIFFKNNQSVKNLSHYIGTFSKILAPTCRVGWIVCDEQYIDQLSQCKEALSLDITTLSQNILTRLLENFDIYKHIEILSGHYQEKRRVLMYALKKYMPYYINYTLPLFGFYCWIELPLCLNATQLLKATMRYDNVSFIPGEAFSNSNRFDHCMRLSISNIKIEKIEIGVQRLADRIEQSYKLYK